MSYKNKFPLLIVVGIYIFLYVPIVILIIFSFNTSGFPSPWKAFTLKWYRELFVATDLWRAFRTSLIVSTTATFLSLSMGILLIFYRSCGGNIKRMVPLFYVNLIIPETVLGVGLLGYFTLFNIPLGYVTLIIAHTILGLGLFIPIVHIRYEQLDGKLIESSLVLGASRVQTFFRIIIPFLVPTIFSTALLIFILSFDDFVLSYFCSGTSVEPLSIYFLSLIRYGISPILNAFSAILLSISIIFAVIFFFLSRKSRIL